MHPSQIGNAVAATRPNRSSNRPQRARFTGASQRPNPPWHDQPARFVPDEALVRRLDSTH
ncbi:hypothetical protein [Streptomyces sp. DH10]|uniref:hypothetical protein n=1 Tax=Streptomyces sp. DH10 TaxID=3040121 RepID=UPI00244215C4|nr:hypothetical protein [Streptomyces sp. DH10]MDG9712718.1 hypothetical protein [Streptomyces sp. DH10]